MKTTAHKKFSLNCLALNEMQKVQFNNVRVVAQIAKPHSISVVVTINYF